MKINAKSDEITEEPHYVINSCSPIHPQPATLAAFMVSKSHYRGEK